MRRKYSITDRLISNLDNFVVTVFDKPHGTGRKNPSSDIKEDNLEETNLSEGLMRVNHCGEVCAQALYQGQALTARTSETRDKLLQASLEENDHLIWCENRLNELNSRPSILNIFWYTNSYTIGVFAGALGDKWSLGFLEETELQVGAHLKRHLKLLPENDLKSRAIVEQMYTDEMSHANSANELGAAKLPTPIKIFMKLNSKVMTSISYYI